MKYFFKQTDSFQGRKAAMSSGQLQQLRAEAAVTQPVEHAQLGTEGAAVERLHQLRAEAAVAQAVVHAQVGLQSVARLGHVATHVTRQGEAEVGGLDVLLEVGALRGRLAALQALEEAGRGAPGQLGHARVNV